jgi:hypothetical protein
MLLLKIIVLFPKILQTPQLFVSCLCELNLSQNQEEYVTKPAFLLRQVVYEYRLCF